jgi:hypothetical protein
MDALAAATFMPCVGVDGDDDVVAGVAGAG